MEQQKETNNWHAQSAEEVIAKLSSDAKSGLSKDEASKRLSQFGRNEIPSAKSGLGGCDC